MSDLKTIINCSIRWRVSTVCREILKVKVWRLTFDDTKVNIEPIAKLRNQLLRRPASTLGLIFSRTGFTIPARYLASFSLPQTILLWTGEELEYALEQQQICELLICKYRICVEEGLPDYDVRERGLDIR